VSKQKRDKRYMVQVQDVHSNEWHRFSVHAHNAAHAIAKCQRHDLQLNRAFLKAWDAGEWQPWMDTYAVLTVLD
jgi:hypothetical protein